MTTYLRWHCKDCGKELDCTTEAVYKHNEETGHTNYQYVRRDE